jgi:hypothetical protein
MYRHRVRNYFVSRYIIQDYFNICTLTSHKHNGMFTKTVGKLLWWCFFFLYKHRISVWLSVHTAASNRSNDAVPNELYVMGIGWMNYDLK